MATTSAAVAPYKAAPGRARWRAAGTELLRAIDPGLGGPVYLLSVRQVRRFFRTDRSILGFTSPVLSLELRPILQRSGAWNGAGFCCVVDRDRAGRARAVQAVVLHEYAHHVADAGATLLKILAEDLGDRLEALRFARARKAPVHIAADNAAFDGLHGPAFYRAAAHLAFRSRRLWPGGFSDLVLFHPGLLSDPLCYEKVLGDEPARRRHETLAAIAASPPPPAFREFAEWDRRRAERLEALISARTDP